MYEYVAEYEINDDGHDIDYDDEYDDDDDNYDDYDETDYDTQAYISGKVSRQDLEIDQCLESP